MKMIKISHRNSVPLPPPGTKHWGSRKKSMRLTWANPRSASRRRMQCGGREVDAIVRSPSRGAFGRLHLAGSAEGAGIRCRWLWVPP